MSTNKGNNYVSQTVEKLLHEQLKVGLGRRRGVGTGCASTAAVAAAVAAIRIFGHIALRLFVLCAAADGRDGGGGVVRLRRQRRGRGGRCGPNCRRATRITDRQQMNVLDLDLDEPVETQRHDLVLVRTLQQERLQVGLFKTKRSADELT